MLTGELWQKYHNDFILIYFFSADNAKLTKLTLCCLQLPSLFIVLCQMLRKTRQDFSSALKDQDCDMTCWRWVIQSFWYFTAFYCEKKYCSRQSLIESAEILKILSHDGCDFCMNPLEQKCKHIPVKKQKALEPVVMLQEMKENNVTKGLDITWTEWSAVRDPSADYNSWPIYSCFHHVHKLLVEGSLTGDLLLPQLK